MHLYAHVVGKTSNLMIPHSRQLVQKIYEPTEATKALKGHLSVFFSKSDLDFFFFQSKLIFVNIRVFFLICRLFFPRKKKEFADQ